MSRRDHGGVRRLLLGVLLACSGLAACGEEPGAPANPPRVPFEQDDEAVRVTRGIREALAQGTRPASPEVQRFKAVALRHVGEPFVEEALLALLPALKDWEGLALYFQAKPSLTPDEEKLLARVHIKLADYGAARDLIRPMADAAPTDSEANTLAGRAHYFYGENEAAALCYDRVADRLLPEQRYQDLAFRAMIHFDEGDAAAARSLLETGLAVAPDDVVLNNTMARVLAGSGQPEEAERYSLRVQELQRELSERETGQMRVAAQIFEINRALQAADVDGCRERIYRLLPEADEALRNQLYSFLEALYRRAGREAELPAVLDRARSLAAGGER